MYMSYKDKIASYLIFISFNVIKVIYDQSFFQYISQRMLGLDWEEIYEKRVKKRRNEKQTLNLVEVKNEG